MRTTQITRRLTMATITTASAFLIPQIDIAASGSACCAYAAYIAAPSACPGLDPQDVDCYDYGVGSCGYTAHCDFVPFWGSCFIGWAGWHCS